MKRNVELSFVLTASEAKKHNKLKMQSKPFDIKIERHRGRGKRIERVLYKGCWLMSNSPVKYLYRATWVEVLK